MPGKRGGPASLTRYFDRVNPALAGYKDAPQRAQDADLHAAWNRLSRQLFVATPRALDRARHFRNRFIRAVR